MVFRRALCCTRDAADADPESQVPEPPAPVQTPEQKHVGAGGVLAHALHNAHALVHDLHDHTAHAHDHNAHAETAPLASEEKQRSFLMRSIDYFDGVHHLSAKEQVEHPALKQRLIEEVNQQIVVRMGIAEDIYNCYFLTLIRKQADGQWLSVSFPSFFFKARLGGWPAWTFILQVFSLFFAVVTSIPEFPLPMLNWDTWVLLVCLMSMNKFVMQVSFTELTIVGMKRDWLARMKERTPHAYDWYTPERARALSFIIFLKGFLMVAMYITFAMVLLSQRESLEYLKNCAGLGFILKQSKVGFNVLKAQDKRRQLGYTGALYVGVAEFNMEVEFEAQGRYGKRPNAFWYSMNVLDILLLLVTLSRIPALHNLTWGAIGAGVSF